MAKTDKTALRKLYHQKRKALAPSDAQRDATLIRQRLLRLPEWEDARTVLCYISMDSEVDTRKIIDEALGRRKRVIVPLFDGSSAPALSELRSLQELSPSNLPGLLEHAQKHRRPALPKEVELAITPGVVFDRQGNRIGFGGGYFDRLFSGMAQAVRIALAYSFQIHNEDLPVLDHDIRIHKIVTEKELIIAPR